MKYAPLDLMLQKVVPALPVPLHGAFEPLAADGHRFLIAGNGTFIEVKRPWMHAIWQDGTAGSAAKPYGHVQQRVTLAFGTIPRWITDEFELRARQAGNVEIAACVIWNTQTKSLELKACEAISASSAEIVYRRPALAAHESLVIDLHSHGYGGAFFSRKDNADDSGEVKIAGVIGNVNGRVTWRFRLCLMGLFVDVPFDPLAAEALPADMEESE